MSAQQQPSTVNKLTDSLLASSMLDLVFVIDATGSMGSYIAQAQATIRTIVESLVSAEKADLRFALISYRDHPPQDSSYVTKAFEFTTSIATMRRNLDTLSASGGGDGPESVVDGLHAALKLDYRSDATKVCILIADAPPHGLGASGDGFPNGCPCGLDPVVVCQNMARDGIALHCIGCEPSLTPYREFFMAMAHITGGLYCPLGSASALENVIVGGVREEMNLEKLVVDAQVELDSMGGMDEETKVQRLWSKMQEKKVVTKQLKVGSSEGITRPTETAIGYSKCASLSEVRKTFSASAAPAAHPSLMSDCDEMCAPVEMCAMSAPRSLSKKKGAGLMSTLSSWMRPAASSAAVESARPHMPASYSSMPAAAPSAVPSGTDYTLADESISLEQCRRLVTKSVARSSKY